MVEINVDAAVVSQKKVSNGLFPLNRVSEAVVCVEKPRKFGLEELARRLFRPQLQRNNRR